MQAAILVCGLTVRTVASTAGCFLGRLLRPRALSVAMNAFNGLDRVVGTAELEVGERDGLNTCRQFLTEWAKQAEQDKESKTARTLTGPELNVER